MAVDLVDTNMAVDIPQHAVYVIYYTVIPSTAISVCNILSRILYQKHIL